MKFLRNWGIILCVALACMPLFGGNAVAEEQESYFLHFQDMQGGVVNNPKIAIDIAELVIANVYGDNEVKRQRPFEVFDESNRWRIEGSYNRGRNIEGPGPIKVWIRKRDAKIIDVVNPYIMKVPPEVKRIIKQNIDKKSNQ